MRGRLGNRVGTFRPRAEKALKYYTRAVGKLRGGAITIKAIIVNAPGSIVSVASHRIARSREKLRGERAGKENTHFGAHPFKDIAAF